MKLTNEHRNRCKNIFRKFHRQCQFPLLPPCINTYSFCFLPTFLGESVYVYCRTPVVELFCYGSVIMIMSLISDCMWSCNSWASHATFAFVQTLESCFWSSKRVQENPSSVCSVCTLPDPLLLNKPSSFGNQPQKPSGPGSKTSWLG